MDSGHQKQVAASRERALMFRTSGLRDSGVEHLIHMSRLAEVQSKQFPKDGEIDLHTPLKHMNNEMLSSAMASRLKRRTEVQEKKISADNDLLMRKLLRHQNQEMRKKHGLCLIQEDPSTRPAFRGSNIHNRVIEAEKIDKDNNVFVGRLVETRAQVDSRNDAKRLDAHKKLVNRLSKFKKEEKFAGASVLYDECKVPQPPQDNEQQRHVKSRKSRSQREYQGEAGWQQLLLHDVAQRYRKEDAALFASSTPRTGRGSNGQEGSSSSQRRSQREAVLEGEAWCNRGTGGSNGGGGEMVVVMQSHQGQHDSSSSSRSPRATTQGHHRRQPLPAIPPRSPRTTRKDDKQKTEQRSAAKEDPVLDTEEEVRKDHQEEEQGANGDDDKHRTTDTTTTTAADEKDEDIRNSGVVHPYDAIGKRQPFEQARVSSGGARRKA